MMGHTPYTDDEPGTRADELRDLAGPVGGEQGATRADDRADGAPPADSPDALTDPSVDEVRSSEDDVVPDVVEDPYELRSMDSQPNPSDDDPGSYLNI